MVRFVMMKFLSVLIVILGATHIATHITLIKQSIMEYNGGALVAMKGKNCVTVAADRRFGVQALTLGTDFQKIFQINDKLFVGLAGLATDVQTL